jgi:alkyl hydroperoxide reductase subunit AhpF
MLTGLNLNLSVPQVTDAVGSGQEEARPQVENVIILGSGPAGWAAATYTARASLRPLLITGSELVHMQTTSSALASAFRCAVILSGPAAQPAPRPETSEGSRLGHTE